jgi:hypothetical protein
MLNSKLNLPFLIEIIIYLPLRVYGFSEHQDFQESIYFQELALVSHKMKDFFRNNFRIG